MANHLRISARRPNITRVRGIGLFLGLLLLGQVILSSCSLIPGSESRIKCPERTEGSEGQICGKLSHLLLGPADQVEGKEPISNAEVLLIDMQRLPDLDETAPQTTPHAELYLLIEAEAEFIHLETAEDGTFSTALSPGEYLLCIKYSPSWSPNLSSYGCTVTSLDSGNEIILRVDYTPMGGFFNFQVE